MAWHYEEAWYRVEETGGARAGRGKSGTEYGQLEHCLHELHAQNMSRALPVLLRVPCSIEG